MPRTTNLTGDLDQLWLLTSNRMRVFREIVKDAESGKLPIATTEKVQQAAEDLSELIISTGDLLEESIGALEHTMEENYVATADLDPAMASQFGLAWDDVNEDYYNIGDIQGTHYQTIISKIQADAQSIVESYNYASTTTVNSIRDGLSSLIQANYRMINGQIRRGFIKWLNPDTNAYELVFGISIASRDIFTQENISSRDEAEPYDSTQTYDVGDYVTHTDGNSIDQTYKCNTAISVPEAWDDTHWDLVKYRPQSEQDDYYLIANDSGTFYGLYTATGWQFWAGATKLGWYDTNDGQLHVKKINIEDNFIMGDWRLTNNGTAFGIKYVGV